jgi:nitrite reductase (NADH) small subunit
MSMSNWIEIGRLADIPPQGARCITSPAGRIAVFRTADDRVFALENRCAHKGGPLSEGIVHGAAVTCPLHNWIYDLETGRAAAPDEGAVRTFAVEIVDGRVRLALSEAILQPAP